MEARVVLADDHAMLREGLRMVLDAQPGILVVGEAEDGRQALDLVERLHPDIVVMDIAMPNLNGAEATRQIKRRFPMTRVVILTMHDNRQYLAQIIEAGAIGAVLKRAAGTDLVAAVHAAARGESYFSPDIATMIEEDFRFHQARQGEDEAEHLTQREREVLQLVAEGKTNREIADALDLSIKTVQTHRGHLMEKLDAHDRTDLVKFAIQQGIIPPQ
jgi:DNA-binding NarL/FixJ family response regulator